MSAIDALAQAVAVLNSGGVIAYPTEAVFGLGCDPFNATAVARLFALKQRPLDQSVLLIAADFAQIENLIAPIPPEILTRVRASWPGPHTWVFPRSAQVPAWLAGKHTGIALRITAHAQTQALCRAFAGALVSTSANRHGQPPALNAAQVHSAFGSDVDFVLDGALGGQERPTPIRDALTGELLRG
ncbi:tRNA threonylcarbamoyladenosine biosynthesis protein RimN [Pseudolysobacter antarcticus]|uniref:Threonylcarbamoyl-AMP synthase n=1 Tax=Pseudolysobacter antarcticus TaxID=2511995 RepID=A0A411HPP6_9GAMM|nr:Sua5/YciO/YrdC/YwlC family protein [Pseudolysobacter antarcticus]QBB72463.1 tRNA threonylcarbamoyladenosine biosynthesis protein RimN [Pseudolysobacter antarcticus]